MEGDERNNRSGLIGAGRERVAARDAIQPAVPGEIIECNGPPNTRIEMTNESVFQRKPAPHLMRGGYRFA